MPSPGRCKSSLRSAQTVRQLRDDRRRDVQVAVDARCLDSDRFEGALPAHAARGRRIEVALYALGRRIVRRHLDGVRREVGGQRSPARRETFRETEAERELLVVAGSAHRHRDGLAVDADLERLLDGDRVPLRPPAGDSRHVDLGGGVRGRLAHGG